jgi:hypothetical protein
VFKTILAFLPMSVIPTSLPKLALHQNNHSVKKNLHQNNRIVKKKSVFKMMKIDKRWNFSAVAGKIIYIVVKLTSGEIDGKKVFEKLNNFKSTFREIDG